MVLMWIVGGVVVAVLIILILVFYVRKGKIGDTELPDFGKRKNPILEDWAHGDVYTFLGVKPDPKNDKYELVFRRPLNSFGREVVKVPKGSLITLEKGSVPGMCDDGIVIMPEDEFGHSPFLDAVGVNIQKGFKRLNDIIEETRTESTTHQIRGARATKGLEQSMKAMRSLEMLQRSRPEEKKSVRSRMPGMEREEEW